MKLHSTHKTKFILQVPIPDCFKVDNIPPNEPPTNLLEISATEIPKSKHTVEEGVVPELAESSCDNNNNNGELNQNSQVTAAAQFDDVVSNYSQRSDIVLVSLNDDSEAGGEEGKVYNVFQK